MERRSQVLLGLGLVLTLAVAGALAVTFVPSGPTLVETWVHSPPEGAAGNHHGVAVAKVDERPLVFAPISGEHAGPACRLVALEGATGEPVWRHQVPPGNCTVHAVADPTVADWDGRPSVLVATTERALFALDPATGAIRHRYGLPSYGYAPPLVSDLAPSPGEELVIVDARGTVQILAANGTVVWQRPIGAYVWTTPVVGDLAADDEPRLAVGTSDGRLLVLRSDGSTALEVGAPFAGSVTWLTAAQLDGDPAIELVVATARGDIVALDAATGAVQWRNSFAEFAAVAPTSDGDGDGTVEVYVTAADGAIRALDGSTGHEEWAVEVAESPVQMFAPPALGDVTGDGIDDLVVASNDGRVVAIDPATGATLADARRNGRVFESPTLADLDDDGDQEVIVIYASGHVVRFDYAA